MLNVLGSCNSRFKNDYGDLIVCCDDRNSWRREVFPHYKAHRRRKRSHDPEKWARAFAAFDTIRDELYDNFPYPVIRAKGAEADDVIGHLNRMNMQDPFARPDLIYSNDDDFIQLVKGPTVLHQTGKDRTLTARDIDAGAYLAEHVIKGDTGDGIPNVFSAADTLVTDGVRQTPATKKRVADVLAGYMPDSVAKRMMLNIDLIDLNNIPQWVRDNIDIAYRKAIDSNPGRTKLLDYFMRHKQSKLLERLGDF